jgi:hypothetical protein
MDIRFCPCPFFWLSFCKHQPLEMAVPGSGAGNQTGGSGTNAGNCDPELIYFQQQVLLILSAHCSMSGCHNETSHQDDVILTSYQKVNCTVGVCPGNPRESKIYKLITEDDPRKCIR